MTRSTMARVVQRMAVGIAVCSLLQSSAWASGVTWRASVATGGAELGGEAFGGSLSADGRFVAFVSFVYSPLSTQIMVHDRDTGVTEVLGQDDTGSIPHLVISPNGRFVGATQFAGFLTPPITLYDRQLGVTTSLGPVDASSLGFSADGRFLVFRTFEALVPEDHNDTYDVFVYDTVTASTERVSIPPEGGEFPTFNQSVDCAISGDGNTVAFSIQISAALALYTRDLQTGVTTLESVRPDGGPSIGSVGQPLLSQDGRYLAFTASGADLVAGDTNNAPDVFVRDRVAQVTERVSLGVGGVQAEAGSESAGVTLSPDGRFVGFHSTAENLVPDDGNLHSDAFVRDRLLATTTRVSVSSAGIGGNNDSYFSGLSADGRYAAFVSNSSNLVIGEGTGTAVFIHDRDGSITCGDGVVQPGEECDDGNAISGDGCEPGCLLPECFGGTTLSGAILKIAGLGAPLGDERMALSGKLVFGPGVPAGFDPQLHGAQVLVEDLGAGSRRVFDITHRTTPIFEDCLTCSGSPLWRVNHSHRGFRFQTSRVPALLPWIRIWNGLQLLTLTDTRQTHGVIPVRVATKGSSITTPVGPLRVTVVPSRFYADGLAGACGTAVLACKASGTSRVICR